MESKRNNKNFTAVQMLQNVTVCFKVLQQLWQMQADDIVKARQDRAFFQIATRDCYRTTSASHGQSSIPCPLLLIVCLLSSISITVHAGLQQKTLGAGYPTDGICVKISFLKMHTHT